MTRRAGDPRRVMGHGELLLGGKKGRLEDDEKQDGWSDLVVMMESAVGGGLSRRLVRVAMTGGRTRWGRQWGRGECGVKNEVAEGEPWLWESDLCGCPKTLWPLKLLPRIMAGMGHTYNKNLCRPLQQFMSPRATWLCIHLSHFQRKRKNQEDIVVAAQSSTHFFSLRVGMASINKALSMLK